MHDLLPFLKSRRISVSDMATILACRNAHIFFLSRTFFHMKHRSFRASLYACAPCAHRKDTHTPYRPPKLPLSLFVPLYCYWIPIVPPPTSKIARHAARRIRSNSHPVPVFDENGTLHFAIFMVMAPIMTQMRSNAPNCV